MGRVSIPQPTARRVEVDKLGSIGVRHCYARVGSPKPEHDKVGSPAPGTQRHRGIAARWQRTARATDALKLHFMFDRDFHVGLGFSVAFNFARTILARQVPVIIVPDHGAHFDQIFLEVSKVERCAGLAW